MEKNYFIADSWDKQKEVFKYLMSHKGVIAVDTEATSVDPFTANLLGPSFSIMENEAFYIIIDDTWTEERWHDLRTSMIKLLETHDRPSVFHNVAYDSTLLKETLGVDVLPYVKADTMLMKHTLDEKRPHGLKETAMLWFGEEYGDEKEELKQSVIANGGKWNKTNKEFFKADPYVLGKYGAADADMTLQLYNRGVQELEEQKLTKFFFEDEVMPLCPIVVNMYQTGLQLDMEYYTSLKSELEQEAGDLEKKAHEDLRENHTHVYQQLEDEIMNTKAPIKLTGKLLSIMMENAGITPVMTKSGKPTYAKKAMESLLEDDPGNFILEWKLGIKDIEDFTPDEIDHLHQARVQLASGDKGYIVNLSSNDQLGNILFNKLGERPPSLTAKGKPQVGKETLAIFEDDYVFIKCMSELRKINKLLSVYVEAAITKNKDGIIHPSWLQHGTDSGRFASREPNYQNLPRDDKRIKYGIMARPGKILVGADYAQLEPRVFSHLSNEESLINSFADGQDFYGTVAVMVFDLECEPNEVKEKYPDLRQAAKSIALGIPYGLKKWALAKKLNKTDEEAQEIIDIYFNSFNNLHKWVLRCHGEAIRYERIVSETGRVRRLKGLKSLKYSKVKADFRLYYSLLNVSVNFKVQSLAASIVNRSMIELNKRFKEEGLDATILMQIHDEIVSECNEKDAERVSQLQKEVMESTYMLKVPLIAEPIAAKRLSELK